MGCSFISIAQHRCLSPATQVTSLLTVVRAIDNVSFCAHLKLHASPRFRRRKLCRQEIHGMRFPMGPTAGGAGEIPGDTLLQVQLPAIAYRWWKCCNWPSAVRSRQVWLFGSGRSRSDKPAQQSSFDLRRCLVSSPGKLIRFKWLDGEPGSALFVLTREVVSEWTGRINGAQSIEQGASAPVQ